MVNKFIKLKKVIEATGLSAPTIYRLAKKNQFPKPVKLSVHASGWVEAEVKGWIEERIATSKAMGGA